MDEEQAMDEELNSEKYEYCCLPFAKSSS